jgi:simple sugar transport system permease protein
MFSTILSFVFLGQVLRISIPYALPALGGTFSERGGVVNIGLEGIMLTSAFASIVAITMTGSPLAGILCGVLAGIMVAGIHAIVSITFKADQIVSGIAINLLAVGVTKFSCQLIYGSSSNSPRVAGIEEWSPAFSPFGVNPFITFTCLILAASYVVLFKTRFGLRLRSVGENPAAADSLGVNVAGMRYAGVLISGALAGLGGTWLALDQHSFTDGMSAGRGFIALAAMIVGKWNLFGAAAACLLFGFAEALTIQLQGGSTSTEFVQMLPYVLTMLVLCGFIGRSIPPAADGIPFEKDR